MKVNSLSFPSTNLIPVGDSNVELVGHLIDTRNHGFFGGKNSPEEFTYLPDGSGSVTYGDWGHVVFNDTLISDTWELNKTAQYGQPLLCSVGGNCEWSGVGDPEYSFVSIGIYDQNSDDWLSIKATAINGNSDVRIEAVRYKDGVDSTIGATVPGKYCRLYLYLSEEGVVRPFYSTGSGLNEMTNMTMSPFYEASVGVTISGELGVEIQLERFRDYPIITESTVFESSLPLGLSLPTQIHGSKAFYEVAAGFPGVFPFNVQGIGEQWLQSLDMELEVRDIKMSVDSPKFVVSPMATADHDAVGEMTCRPLADPDPFNSGNLKVHQECICDGSAKNSDKAIINLSKQGHLHKAGEPSASKERPSFTITDPKAGVDGKDITYGESFDPQRIHLDETIWTVDPGKQLRNLKTLELSNGNRIYYGMVSDEVSDPVNVDFLFTGHSRSTGTGSGLTYTIRRVGVDEPRESTHNDVYQYNSHLHIGTSLPLGPSVATHSLAPGRYVLLTNDLSTEILLNHNGEKYLIHSVDLFERYTTFDTNQIDGPPPPPSTYNTELGRGHWLAEKREHKILFEVKAPVASFVAYHYDKCNSTISKIDTATINVDTIAESLSCVELGNGDVSVLFNEILPGRGFDDSFSVTVDHTRDFSSRISMSKLDLGTELFSSVVYCNCSDSITGGGDSVYAFDAKRIDDDLHLFISFERFDDFMVSPSLNRYVKHLKTKVKDVDTPGSLDFETGGTLTIYNVQSSLNMPGGNILKRLYEEGIDGGPMFPEEFFNIYEGANPSVAGDQFGRIDATYNKDRGEFLVSVLNHRSQVPLIVSGNTGNWQAVGIPAHFNFRSGGTINSGHRGMLWTNIQSFSAAFGNDGMIYTIATKGIYIHDTDLNMGTTDLNAAPYNFSKRSCEIGVLDLDNAHRIVTYDRVEDILNSSSLGIDYNEVEFPHFEYKRFAFRTIPFFNHYLESKGVTSPPLMSLENIDGYLVLTSSSQGSGFYGPVVYQCGYQDSQPLEVPMDEVWSPIRGNGLYKSDQYVANSLKLSIDNSTTAGGNPEKLSRIIGVDGFTFDVAESQTGYRFSIKLKPQGVNIDNLFTENLHIECRVERPNLFTTGSQYSRALIVYNGKQADFRTWSTELGKFVSVGKVCDIDPSSFVEFDILIRHSSLKTNHQNLNLGSRDAYPALVELASKFQAAMIVKHCKHTSNSLSNSHMYDFRKVGGVVQGEGDPDPTELSLPTLSVYFDNAHQGDSYIGGGSVDIYEAGWGLVSRPDELLSADYSDISTTNTKWLFNGLEVDRPLNDGPSLANTGPKWREFNDTPLITSDVSAPSYNFRMSEASESKRASGLYHWPNGMEFFFTGSSGSVSDTWSLGRSVLSSIADVQPDVIQGNYSSDNDEAPLVIWLDAESAGLDYFDVDTVVVKGVNVPTVKVVGRNVSTDPWTEMGQIDLTRYSIPQASVTAELITTVDLERDAIIKIADATFVEGAFSEFTHYIQSGTGRAVKISDSSKDRIWARQREIFEVSGDLKIFVDRGCKILDEPSRFKQIGIMIDPVATYEGRFTVESFGIGRAIDMPIQYNHDIGSGVSITGDVEVNFVFDEQPYVFKPSRLVKEFDLSYNIADDKVAKSFESIVRSTAMSRLPIWMIESYAVDRSRVYLCLMSGDMDSNVLFDEQGQRFTEFNVSLRSVE